MRLVRDAIQRSAQTLPLGRVSRGHWVVAGVLARLASVALSVVALMALMGLARIRAGEHWASDVPGGYVIGVASLCLCALPVRSAR